MGQFVLTQVGEIAAVVYTQKIRNSDSIITSSNTVPDNSGNVIQLLGALSDPKFATIQPGNLLIEFILQLNILRGLEVCAVTRWSSFKKWKSESRGRTAEQYFALGSDPTVNWHKASGATVVRLIPSYRPEDAENEGYGVLISYKQKHALSTKLPKQQAKQHTKFSYSICLDKMKEMIADILSVRKANIPDDGSLFSIGLDSLSLFELRERIAYEFQVEFPPPTIFFQYSCFILNSSNLIRYMSL